MSALDILKKYWGYSGFRDLQEDIINSVLEGRDTLGLMPTGGGKSITFQVPALMLDGLTLVVTPIISLMKDQVDNLIVRHIKATYLHAGLSLAERRKAIDKCLYGNCKFLYVSPERLSSDGFIDKLRLMNVSLIVVDEAAQARYVRVEVEGTLECPSWHYGVGHPSWFFIDEVVVN